MRDWWAWLRGWEGEGGEEVRLETFCSAARRRGRQRGRGVVFMRNFVAVGGVLVCVFFLGEVGGWRGGRDEKWGYDEMR